jgi:hypothetical protein
MFLLTCVLLMGITVTGLDRNLFDKRGAALCHAVEYNCGGSLAALNADDSMSYVSLNWRPI